MDRFRTVVSEDSELRSLRRQMREWLGLRGVTDDCVDRLVLAAHEAVANAVEHTLPNRPINVEVQLETDLVSISVADEGQWKNHRPEPDTDRRSRGLTLIRSLVDDVTIRTTREGTTVQMRQRVASAG